MSKIDEIRKRHEDRKQQLARLGPIAQYEATAEQAHLDRATLLAALDGEWQREVPTEGEYFVSRPPNVRRSNSASVESVDVDESGGVWSAEPGLDGGYMGQTEDALFTGALWQRRTVPRDPFAKGGRE